MPIRSADPLTAATTSYWAPLLKSNGFHRYGKPSFGRIADGCVLQYIELQLSHFGGKDFAVNYASLLVTRLHQHIGSTTFRRLPRGKSGDGWWSAKTLERADRSMEEVSEKTANIAIPWFDKTSTPHGLAEVLLTLTKDRNAHTFFELGCCYATIGQLDAAHKHLSEAARLFQAWYEEFPACTFALVERDLAQQLASAITDGAHTNLLSEWRKQTILNLKLDKLNP